MSQVNENTLDLTNETDPEYAIKNELLKENIKFKLNKSSIELEDLLNYKELNKDNNLVLYYNKLLKLINFELVDRILISDLERVENFLAPTNNSLNKVFAKVLQKK